MTCVPQIIHCLVCDPVFRTQFQHDPYGALEAAYLSLDEETLAVLRTYAYLFQISPGQLYTRVISEEPVQWLHTQAMMSEAHSRAD